MSETVAWCIPMLSNFCLKVNLWPKKEDFVHELIKNATLRVNFRGYKWISSTLLLTLLLPLKSYCTNHLKNGKIARVAPPAS